ncbi:hypothetical protein MBRA1_002049 [Malassezia brasiliensis]|uniref:UBX domain-containing protein n=1 Tax=Malassezia brasiliensis TaxID=1821822 RepID=A0AAF0IPX8_9BASI|nr:hypothetical protein MBRA1_002049 [Malassezia brasiliensis]
MSAQESPDPTLAPVSVYRAPNNRAYAPPPPEHDNFEPTSAELREAFASAIQQRNGPNAPLMTSAMRARQEAASGRVKKQYDTVRIRVRFSDRTQIEHTFPHSATINDVYTMVDSTLHEGGQGDYVLFQSPPKRDFPRNQIRTTLVQLGFAPAAVLGIRWADPARNATDAPAPLRSDVAARARDMPLPPSFATQIPSVRPNASDGTSSDAQQAREKRKFPKWFKSTGGK